MSEQIAHFKDESLDRLADTLNVAQFVSFSADSRQRFARVLGFEPNHRFATLRDSAETLLRRSSDGTVNVRSYLPNDPRSHDFVYGLGRIDEVVASVNRMAGEGLHTIINETVDIHDGGVSGVIERGVMEFAPDDTPRCVEKPGVVSLPESWGMWILNTVYGVAPDSVGQSNRLEFSVHPKARGWRNTQVIGWELERVDGEVLGARIQWPNHFSRLIGDKAFGLLMAAAAGLPVPTTVVIGRRVAPFSFGVDTGNREVWLRTCPKEQVPGRFTTTHGWVDPFALMAKEDATGELISSIIAQRAVPSVFSGALIVSSRGELVVEGKRGQGEVLMKGIALPENLPREVVRSVKELYARAEQAFGPIRMEWVYDGAQAWIVQMHRGATLSDSSTLVPGEASRWVDLNVSAGLEEIRRVLTTLQDGEGLQLRGQVGLTSHIADVVRKAVKPARIVGV